MNSPFIVAAGFGVQGMDTGTNTSGIGVYLFQSFDTTGVFEDMLNLM